MPGWRLYSWFLQTPLLSFSQKTLRQVQPLSFSTIFVGWRRLDRFDTSAHLLDRLFRAPQFIEGQAAPVMALRIRRPLSQKSILHLQRIDILPGSIIDQGGFAPDLVMAVRRILFDDLLEVGDRIRQPALFAGDPSELIMSIDLSRIDLDRPPKRLDRGFEF